MISIRADVFAASFVNVIPFIVHDQSEYGSSQIVVWINRYFMSAVAVDNEVRVGFVISVVLIHHLYCLLVILPP